MNYKEQGILYRTKFYLAGAMQNDSSGNNWRIEAEAELSKLGIFCFNPYSKPFLDSDKLEEGNEAHQLFKTWMKEGRLDLVAERMKPIRNFDLNCIDRADAVICKVNPNVPTWGTPEELSLCSQIRRPTFIFVEGGREFCPYWLLAMFNPKYIYNSLEEIINVLKDIHLGKEPINNDKWRLLKREFR